MLTSIFRAVESFFGFFGLKQKEKIEVMTNESHKSAAKRKQEEILKSKVNKLLNEIDNSSGKKQKELIDELRKLLSD